MRMDGPRAASLAGRRDRNLPSRRRGSRACAPRPRPRKPPLDPARPWRAARVRLLRARRAVAARPLHPDLRPVGVDHLGSRGHAPRPRHDERAVVEAAADPVHRAVLAARRRRRAAAVAPRRARRRAARVRDGVPARLAARRPRGGRARRARARPRRTSSSATSRAATPRACSSRCACGRSSSTSTGAAAARSCSASRPGCCAPRCGRSWRCTASGCARRVARPRPVARDRPRRRRRRADAGRVVRPGVLRLGLRAARRRARPPAQPRLGRVRRLPVPRGLPPLLPRSSRFPVYLGAAMAVLFAWPRRREWRGMAVLTLAAISTALMVAVALMTEAGFAGQPPLRRAARRDGVHPGGRGLGRSRARRCADAGAPRAGDRAGRRGGRAVRAVRRRRRARAPHGPPASGQRGRLLRRRTSRP